MDIIFEFIFDLIFEGTFSLSKSKKVSKWIRYPLIALIILFYIAFVGLFFLVSVGLFKDDNPIGGVICFILGLLVMIGVIVLFRKSYFNKKQKSLN